MCRYRKSFRGARIFGNAGGKRHPADHRLHPESRFQRFAAGQPAAGQTSMRRAGASGQGRSGLFEPHEAVEPGLSRHSRSRRAACADIGNLFGALEFSETLAEKGIQPIIGCTLKVDFNDLTQDSRQPAKHQCAVLALLAKDAAGYSNLMKLSSRAYLDTPDHAEPHVPISEIFSGRSNFRKRWRKKASSRSSAAP